MKKLIFLIQLFLLFSSQSSASDFKNLFLNQDFKEPILYFDLLIQKKLEEKEQKSKIYFVYSKSPGDSEYYKLFIKSIEWTPILPGSDDPFFGFVTKADENFLLCISGISDLVIYHKDNPTWKLDFVMVSDKFGLRFRFPF